MTEKEMKDHIIKLLKTTDRILYILESDSRTNEKGLVEDVSDMKATLHKIEIENKARNITSGFLGGISAIIIGFVIWLIKALATKEF